MDFVKVISQFFLFLLIGLIGCWGFLGLSFSEVSSLFCWLASLTLGSFFGAKLFLLTKQKQLISFSMPLAFILCGWTGWLLYHVVDYNIFPFLLIIAGGFSLNKMDREDIKKVLSFNTYFLLIFWLVLLCLSFHPDIYGGEKGMDFNLLNFMGRNSNFPPEDPWFFGHRMKYYYFGYFLFGKFGSFFSLSRDVAYQACLATSAGFFFLAGMSFLNNFKKKFSTVLLGSSLLFFATSFGGWSSDKKGFSAFWDATRVFKNGEFAEFPSWSFLFADLHPHVMSYAYSLFAMTLILGIMRGAKRKAFSLSNFILGFSLGALGALNTWDFIFCALFFIILAAFHIKDLYKDYSLLIAFLIGGVCWSPMALSLLGGKESAFYFFLKEHNNILNYFIHQGFWWILLAVFFVLAKKKKEYFFIIVSYLLILLLSESFVLMDRMNTIFKFNNQLFVLIGITSLLYYDESKKQKYVLCSFLVLAIVSFSKLQIDLSSYNSFGVKRPSLKGTKYIQEKVKVDYKIIDYINRNISGTPLLVETHGKSFQYNRSRISTHTGVPSYLGWEGHVLMRGVIPRESLSRKLEIDALYRSTDPLKSFEWLKKRNIKYVVVGLAEHDEYERRGLEKFHLYVDLFVPLVQSKISNMVFGLYRVGEF